MQEKIPLSIVAKVENSKLMVHNVNRWNLIKRHFEGKTMQITVEEFIDKRTLGQNAFYWLYLGLIADETGDNPNDLHEFFKKKFIPPKFVKIFGEEVALQRTTTKMDKKTFSDYLEKISALSGVPIPNTEAWKNGEI